jgi:DNA-binding NarL/FixJ family response regulator
MKRRRTSVALVDDHAVVRKGIRALLAAEDWLEVVGEAGNGAEALAFVDRLAPDVLVLDLSLPDMSGLELARRLRRDHRRTRIVVFSMHADEGHVAEALRAGATAYVLKGGNGGDLAAAIRSAAAGRRYLGPSISAHALDAYLETIATAADPADSLTRREWDVLRLSAQGMSSSRAGRALGISARTVETHRANAMRKLGLESRTQLIRFALQRGLVEGHAAPPRPPHAKGFTKSAGK